MTNYLNDKFDDIPLNMKTGKLNLKLVDLLFFFKDPNKNKEKNPESMD